VWGEIAVEVKKKYKKPEFWNPWKNPTKPVGKYCNGMLSRELHAGSGSIPENQLYL